MYYSESQTHQNYIGTLKREFAKLEKKACITITNGLP